MEKNPKFIVYGDSRPGWRIQEKFLWKKNWLTWKMLMVPFYEAYWLGNGVVGGINWLRHTPDYGVRERRMVRDAVYAEANQSGVDFILSTGDMPVDGRRPSDWGTFLKENKEDRPLVSDFPFLPVVGNHEKTNDLKYGLPNYEAIFEYPKFYVLDFPDAALFVVDSNVILDQYQFIDDDEQDNLFQEWFVSGEDSAQHAWLERELASRNQHFKIVVMHHPLVSFAKHHIDWTRPSLGRNLQQKRQQLLKLFHEQRVQAVLCGHEHLYEHSIVRYSSHVNPAECGIHFIVSGGGGG
ncbi:MAG: metallophosphoesterase family protein, partial [Candidatus Bathyarchaeia archaeon]